MLDCLYPIKIKPLQWPWHIDGTPMTLEQSGALIQLVLYRWGSQSAPSPDEARKILRVTKARARKLRVDRLLEFAAELCKQRAPINASLRTHVARQNSWRCSYCGADVGTFGENLHIDHATPVARGGFSTFANYKPACGPCNIAKGTMTEAEFLAHMEGCHEQA